MATPGHERERDSTIEVHGFSFEDRTVMLSRLHEILMANGCFMIRCRRSGSSVEYRFELELTGALELYCGLVRTGLQLTDITHRTLTDLCTLRAHEGALSGHRSVLNLRLLMTFLQVQEETEATEAMAASA